MRTHAIAALLALAAALLGAPRASTAPQDERSITLTSNDGAWVVECTLDAMPPPLNERFGATVRVRPAEGREAGAVRPTLGVDARMPQHRHGMRVEPRVEERAGDEYRVDGLLFHMPGRWELYLDVTQGAVTERAQHAVELD